MTLWRVISKDKSPCSNTCTQRISIHSTPFYTPSNILYCTIASTCEISGAKRERMEGPGEDVHGTMEGEEYLR